VNHLHSDCIVEIKEFFHSRAENRTMTMVDADNFVPSFSPSLNDKLKRKIKAQKRYEHIESHIRIGSLIIEFFHDGISLDRVNLPEIDELAPAWEQELILRDWLLYVPKRVIEVDLKKGETLTPYLAPLEFMYTQKGLINEANLLDNAQLESLVIEEGTVLGFKCYGGLKGGEKAIIHTQWDEYFTVFLK
jgi:hypothetical protein